MRKVASYRLALAIGGLVLIQACGCNLIPFSGKDGGDTGFANTRTGKNGPGPQDKQLTPSGKNDFLLPPPTPLNEQAAVMNQKLGASEDDRKVLAARLQQMDIQLQEKEKAIVLANYEIKEAAKQVALTREELKRWKEEMDTLRGQLRNVEKENKGTLEAIIRTLEQFMDREKEKAPETMGT